MELGRRREMAERAEMIAATALAQSGDKKAIVKELRRLDKESR
jgi:hypothetical protein